MDDDFYDQDEFPHHLAEQDAKDRRFWTIVETAAIIIGLLVAFGLILLWVGDAQGASRPRVPVQLVADRFADAEIPVWRHNLGAAQPDTYKYRCRTLNMDRNGNASRFYCHLYIYHHVNGRAYRLLHLEVRLTTVRSDAHTVIYEDGSFNRLHIKRHVAARGNVVKQS